jgi:hypothetical protein
MSLNGRIDKLEHEAERRQPEDNLPSDESLINLIDVYMAQLDRILSDVSPDVLEAVDEALREFDAPPESSVVEYIKAVGIHYHHFLPGPGCRTLVYRWPLIELGMKGAHAWILADLLDKGVACLVTIEPAMKGDLVITGSSDAWLSPYAPQHSRYRICQLIDRIENGTPAY